MEKAAHPTGKAGRALKGKSGARQGTPDANEPAGPQGRGLVSVRFPVGSPDFRVIARTDIGVRVFPLYGNLITETLG